MLHKKKSFFDEEGEQEEKKMPSVTAVTRPMYQSRPFADEIQCTPSAIYNTWEIWGQ
ncbi:unnamed protein product [Nesidiocoris tenuis]|uniref:Uncharacterized protein n=1 Tax=Nesidiocoris tenuis TaxID=355587 RepID=A0A6H5G5B8_9HEMI|nr:unnamed protein product [Nesidiocoris tenuis]